MAREKDAPAGTQAHQASGEPEHTDKKDKLNPEQAAYVKREAKEGEPQFFDGSIAKMVEREVEDDKGNTTTEWVEVVSDNLYPGEKTKSAYDAEQAEKKQKAADKDKDRNTPDPSATR